MFSLIRIVLQTIGGDARRCLPLQVFFAFASAGLDTLGIGLIVPLMQTTMSSGGGALSGSLGRLWQGGIDTIGLGGMTVALVGFFLLKGILLTGINYHQNLTMVRCQAEFSTTLLENYLWRPYTFHLSRNSAELTRNLISLPVRLFLKVLQPLLQLLIEITTALAILILLVAIDPLVTLGVSSLLMVAGLAFHQLLQKRIVFWGMQTVEYDKQVLQWVNQSLGSVKPIQLGGLQAYFRDAFARPSLARAKFQALSVTAPIIPRIYVETVALGALLGSLWFMVEVTHRPQEQVLSVMALFGLAALRLLPSVSRIFQNLQLLKENRNALDILHQEVASNPRREPGKTRLAFDHSIDIRDLRFAYPGSDTQALKGVSLTITKGQAVAVVGRSGSGKTTLIDALLGLLSPDHGQILVDGQPIASNIDGWQRQIGYIPQEIYVMDDSLRRNVALGVADAAIDDDKVRQVLAMAHLTDLLKDLPEGLDTRLGDRGSRLSGGQRQRLGIARALYHDPVLLVMDEATSALDASTEREVADAIDDLTGDKTVIIIAHRLTTVRHCNRLFLLENGQVVGSGSFDELARDIPQFAQMVSLSQLN